MARLSFKIKKDDISPREETKRQVQEFSTKKKKKIQYETPGPGFVSPRRRRPRDPRPPCIRRAQLHFASLLVRSHTYTYTLYPNLPFHTPATQTQIPHSVTRATTTDLNSLDRKDKSLDGQYLTTLSGAGRANTTSLVAYASSSKPGDEFIKFSPVVDPDTKLAELRTPSSTSDAALAVVGSNGLFDFASVPDPDGTADELPEGTTVDWTSFRLKEEGDVRTVEYGRSNAAAKGGWFAFPIRESKASEKGEAWGIKWKEGK